MKHLLLLLPLATGCSTWTGTQVELVHQARRGTDLLAESNAKRSVLLQAEMHLRRAALDASFDTDVRNAELTPDWVIAHRKGYAAGLDALHERQADEARASEVDRRNAAAVRGALDRLAWLLDLQRRAANFQPLTPENKEPAHAAH